MQQGKISFGKNLRVLRELHEVSQQTLADAIHVTRQTLSAWERGAGKPDIYAVHDVCEYFGVTMENLVYGNYLGESANVHYESDFECCNYIESICAKGFYTIIEEDLDEFLGIIYYDLAHIAAIALQLSRRGYMITEVFSNGFSVYCRSAEEAECFKKTLGYCFDDIMHRDNDYMEQKLDEVGRIIKKAYGEVCDRVMSEILGADVDSFAYYWVDDEENIRGYARTEEECAAQAKEQECEGYKIISHV